MVAPIRVYVRLCNVSELEQKQQEIAELRQHIALLEQKIDLLVRQLYGRKSEKLDPGQLDLLFGEDVPGKSPASVEEDQAAEASEDSAGAKKRSKARRARIPENLPVEAEQIIDPEPVKACPEAWRCIGEEISEQLDFRPGHFFRRRIIRRKYVRRADPEAAPIIAPLPPKLVERGIAAPGLLAHVAVSKFCDHLPLFRQEQIFDTRFEVFLPRQSLSRWMAYVGDWLQPVYREMKETLFNEGYLQVDETPVKYLKPGSGKAQQGYFWTYHVPGGDVIFDWQSSRAHRCLEEVIPENFHGLLQCDGYGAYRTFAAKRPGITLVGCWAHVRRKFFEALCTGQQQATPIVEEIRKLYHIETELRQVMAAPLVRLEVRQQRSRPIIESLHERLTDLAIRRVHLPQSSLGKAIRYTLDLWECLTLFLGNGRLEIDNNLTENSIRPTAIGKKNWLFVGREDTGWRSAVIYSVLGSCRYQGIEPYGYLKALLEVLPSATNWQIKDLTPAAWAEGRHLNVVSVAA